MGGAFGLNLPLLRSFQLLYGLFICMFVKQPGCLSFAVEHSKRMTRPMWLLPSPPLPMSMSIFRPLVVGSRQ